MQKRFEARSLDVRDVEAFRVKLRALVRQLHQLEQHHDLSGEALPPSYAQALIVLLGFHAHEEQPTLTTLVELLDIDKSNVTRLCQKMERAGHVHISRDPNDRRAKRIALSDAGLALAEHINSASLSRLQRVLSGLSDAERVNVVEALELLQEQLNAQLT